MDDQVDGRPRGLASSAIRDIQFPIFKPRPYVPPPNQSLTRPRSTPSIKLGILIVDDDARKRDRDAEQILLLL